MSIITIQYADPTESGKSLRIKDTEGNLYYCKDFSIGEYIRRQVDIATSQSEYKGRAMTWINDWSEAGDPVPRPTTAPQGAPVRRPAEPSGVDRDASIVAQTLCKSLERTFDSMDAAFAAYQYLYLEVVAWHRAGCPDPRANAPTLYQEPNDDIPF